MDDFHSPTTQDVRRSNYQRIADILRKLHRLLLGARSAVGRLAQLEVVQQLLEAFAVFGGIDHVGRGADDRHAVGFQGLSQFERRLSAVLYDDAERLFPVDDFQHVFQGYWLEIQTVGGVVVGRDGFRIAVDHDGFETIFAQGHYRMYAAIVEFDALPDPVRPAAQHDDFFPFADLGFAFF